MAFLKQLAKKELFVPHIERYLNKGEFPDNWNFVISPNKAKDDFFHPSGDCTPCERFLYAKFKEPDLLPINPINATSHKNFMVGHFWHGLMQDIFVATGMAEQKEIERRLLFEPRWANWTAVGHADVATAYAPGHVEPYLIDFKTMNSRAFSSGPGEDLLWKWRLQVNCYMDWMHTRVVDPPKHAVMILIQKDSPHTFKEIVIDYEPDIIENVYDKWTRVHEALVTNEIPQCDCPLGRCPLEGTYV